MVEDSYRDILVTGSWFIIEDIRVRADPPTHDLACDRQPAGVRYGIYVDDGSRHGIIRRVLATELYTGVRIARGASYHQVVDSDFRDNSMKSNVPTSDSGAIAIDLQGDHNLVARNRISGSDTCSPFFGGRDGSAISVYGGKHNVISHNQSRDNHDFVELGDPRTDDTLIVYNADHSSLRGSTFAVIHGLGSRYGPVGDTRIVHNTSVLTGAGSNALMCSHDVAPDDLQLTGNILWAEQDVATCNDGFNEGDNIYWATDGSPLVKYELAPTSRMVDPRLVDPRAGDLRLRPGSPAIDAVRPMDLGTLGAVDVDGVLVPQGYAPDIGAHEFTTEPVPSGSATIAPEPAASATPTPRSTPPPEPRPSSGATHTPPPTGGPGALDQLILLAGVVGVGGLLVAVPLARRPRR